MLAGLLQEQDLPHSGVTGRAKHGPVHAEGRVSAIKLDRVSPGAAQPVQQTLHAPSANASSANVERVQGDATRTSYVKTQPATEIEWNPVAGLEVHPGWHRGSVPETRVGPYTFSTVISAAEVQGLPFTSRSARSQT